MSKNFKSELGTICSNCIKGDQFRRDFITLSKFDNQGINVKTGENLLLELDPCSFCNGIDSPRLKIGIPDTIINGGLGTNQFLNLLKIYILQNLTPNEIYPQETPDPTILVGPSLNKIVDNKNLLSNKVNNNKTILKHMINLLINLDGGQEFSIRSFANTEHKDKFLKDFSCPLIKQIQNDLIRQNFFQTSSYYISEISKYLKIFEIKLNKGKTSFFRARIGAKQSPKKEAYSDSEIGAAPIDSCRVGRLNRAGESFLYLSRDQQTAIYEVRPHPGHLVSTGQFQCIKGLKLISMKKLSLLTAIRSKHEFDAYLFLKTMNDLFSAHVPPDQINKYKITQYFAWVIRNQGYDGIEFKSSLKNGGINYVIFNPSNMRYVNNSAELLEVKNLSYKTASVKPSIP